MTAEAKWSDLVSQDRAKTIAAVNQLLPGWISLILVIVIAWQLARLVWMLIPAPAAGDAVTPPAGQPSGVADSGMIDVNVISQAHLFGVASEDDAAPASAPSVTEVDAARETRLSLELKGTIASNDAEKAAAIISSGGNEEQVYMIGASVANGAELHAVYADRVVLNENGVLTSLNLPKDFPEGSSSQVRRNDAEPIETMGDGDGQSIQSVLSQNVSQLSDIIRPTPYFVDGQQQGYRVYPGRDRAQFTALGLRPGDLIKDIDGQALTDPAQAMQIFQSLGSADEVSVTVERNGQPETLVLRTEQLDISDEHSQ